MDNKFLTALAFALKEEGGISDTPGDRGGLTKWGVTQATYDRYRRQNGLHLQPVTDMQKPEMLELYYSQYYGPSHAGDFDQNLATVLLDTAINCSPLKACKLLQQAAGVKQDGVVGPVTVIAVKKLNEKALLNKYLTLREQYYGDICDHDSSQEKFYNSWMNRCDDLRHLCGLT